MAAIITKFLPATDSSGARVSAITKDKKRFFYHFLESVGSEGSHRAAAEAYKDRCGFVGDLIGGELPDGTGYAFVLCKKTQ